MGSGFHGPANVYWSGFPGSLGGNTTRSDAVKNDFARFVLMTLIATLALSAQTPKTTTPEEYWSALLASFNAMHTTMGSVTKSGDGDVDFVRLMLPHHQAAIDMAKAQLLN